MRGLGGGGPHADSVRSAGPSALSAPGFYTRALSQAPLTKSQRPLRYPCGGSCDRSATAARGSALGPASPDSVPPRGRSAEVSPDPGTPRSSRPSGVAGPGAAGAAQPDDAVRLRERPAGQGWRPAPGGAGGGPGCGLNGEEAGGKRAVVIFSLLGPMSLVESCLLLRSLEVGFLGRWDLIFLRDF